MGNWKSNAIEEGTRTVLQWICESSEKEKVRQPATIWTEEGVLCITKCIQLFSISQQNYIEKNCYRFVNITAWNCFDFYIRNWSSFLLSVDSLSLLGSFSSIVVVSQLSSAGWQHLDCYLGNENWKRQQNPIQLSQF